MSLVLETYSQGNVYIECRYDKYAPHYVVFVGEKQNGLVLTLWKKRYPTKEQAQKSFERQVKKIKKKY